MLIFFPLNVECISLAGDFAQPVCLPLPGEIFPPKTTCIVAGWGRIKESKKIEGLITWLLTLIATFLYLAVLPILRRSDGFSSSWSAVEPGGSSHLRAHPTDHQTRPAKPHSAVCWTRERRERCLPGTNPTSINYFLKAIVWRKIPLTTNEVYQPRHFGVQCLFLKQHFP